MGEPTEVSYSLAIFGSLALLLMALSVVIFFLRYQKKMLERQQHELEQQVKVQEQLRLQEQTHQRLLLESVVQTQEREQRRIAEDLHDEIGPVLTFIKLQVATLSRSIKEKEELAALSKDIYNKLGEAITSIRKISHDLLPSVVDDLGILAGLQALARDITASSSINFTLKAEGLVELTLEKRHEVTLYRIVQELVHNSIKHGHPSEIGLSLNVTDENLSLLYQDNGIGFSAKEKLSNKTGTHGLGLRNMEGRLAVLNGTSKIYSAPGEGFCMSINIPLVGKADVLTTIIEVLHTFP